MELDEIIEKMKGKKVLVLGDVTFDKYTMGQVTRISPEAPVPMVEIESESYFLGGAANVIKNLCALEAKVSIATVIGDDPEGGYLIREIEKMGVDALGIFKDQKRITTMISRILASDNHQLLRLDRAENKKIDHEMATKLADYVKGAINAFDALIIADYGRGVITQELVSNVVKIAKESGKKVVVNPKKEDFPYYEGVDVVRTNRREASYATGVSAINETSIRIMGQKILTSLRCGAVLITWIEEGFHLFERDGKVTFIPPLVKRPIDVTGVGDTITCVLALGLAAGATVEKSSRLANYAGAIVANKKGLATVTLGELKEAVTKNIFGA
jgi:D-beta-D-heptose 7-phosphate kinase/D-beta-D-heptose 1-phosphate adenosyltransferase